MRLELSALLTIATVTTASTTGSLHPQVRKSPAFVSLSGTSRKRFLHGQRISKTCTTPTLHRTFKYSSSLQTATFSDVTTAENAISNTPKLGKNSIHEVNDENELAALIESTKNKLVVLNVFAPWCHACKSLSPKFNAIVRDPKFNEGIPIVWASLSVQHNKDLVNSLGVKMLPSVQFYVGGQKQETFGCGPSKVPVLRQKLAAFINDNVDPITRLVKMPSAHEPDDYEEECYTEFASEFDFDEYNGLQP